MFQNSSKILFLITLTSGLLITLCANSWLGAWMGLEINLLSFIPLMSASSQNMLSNEASLKYFLVQAIASSSLLFMILFKMNFQETIQQNLFMNNSWNSLLLTPLFLKVACAPFHWWLPSVIEGLSWMNCFLILSVQKIAPLILISYLLTNNLYTQILILLTALVGAIGGFNQVSLRKILSFSSINHMGWMLATMISGSNIWFLYISIYILNLVTISTLVSSLNLSFMSQTFCSINNPKKLLKSLLFMSMLSLGGLPPFLGFFPKWIAIQFMTQSQMSSICLILISSSLLTLFFYMRIMYPALMISNSETPWLLYLRNQFSFSSSKPLSLSMSLSTSLLGIIISTIIISIY